MSTYLKKAIKTPETDERETQAVVERILKDVRKMEKRPICGITARNSKIGTKK